MPLLFMVAACNPFSSSEKVVCAEQTPPMDGLEVATIGQYQNDKFVDIADDAVYPVSHGIQGGQHIEVSVRFFGTDGDRWSHHVTVVDDGSKAELARTEVTVDACVPGWTETHAIRVVLEEDGSRTATLSLVVTRLDDNDQAVRSIEGSWTIQIRDE